jgi:hypothetical protein
MKYIRGDLFLNKRENQIYMLAQVDWYSWALINLTEGNRWNTPEKKLSSKVTSNGMEIEIPDNSPVFGHRDEWEHLERNRVKLFIDGKLTKSLKRRKLKSRKINYRRIVL